MPFLTSSAGRRIFIFCTIFVLAIPVLGIECQNLSAQNAAAMQGTDPTACPAARPAKYRIKEEAKEYPVPAVPEGKAIVHFIGKKSTGFSVGGGGFAVRKIPSTEIWVNGQFVAAINVGNYSSVVLEPGLAKICLTAEKTDPQAMYLTVQAGRQYYVGGNLPGKFSELEAQDSMSLIKKSRYATLEKRE